MTIEWTIEYSVGVGVLDRQHQRIFQLINDLDPQAVQEVSSEVFSEIISELVQYSSRHLKLEEEYLQKYSYPDYELHRRSHTAYKKKLAELNAEILNKNKHVSQKVFTFLSEWWTDHILKIDMKYKDFFTAKGVK